MASRLTMLCSGQEKEAVSKFFALKTKIALINKDIWFNHQCLNNQVIPNYVGIKAQNSSRAAKKATEIARVTWVKTEIRSLHAKKQVLYEQVDRIQQLIINNQYDIKPAYNDSKDKFLNNLKYVMHRKQIILDYKLERLINIKYREFNRDSRHQFYKKVENLTDVQISSNENRLLEKGLKYNLEGSYRNKNCLKQTVVECERALGLVDPRERNHARHLMLEKLNKVKKLPEKIDNSDRKTLKTLKDKLRDNKILVLKADKGNTTVLVKQDDYVKKTEEFINDNGIVEIKKDPTVNFQNNIKTAIRSTNLILTKEEKGKLVDMNPQAPTLRALPKIHKDNIPIRPIINFRQAPSYKLSSFLHKYIRDNVKLENNRSVINSADLVNQLKSININSSNRMASLDVKSMYTKIPVKEAIGLVKENLLKNNVSLNETEEVTKLLTVTLGQNYFKFNNKIYLQKEGLAMGSPLSGIMADIYMNYIENKIYNTILNFDGSIKWYRFVDDVLIIYNHNNITIDQILNISNNINANIVFTKEIETDNLLNYLDIAITRTSSKLETAVFRKGTTTSHVIHHDSCHPAEHKQAAFRCYINRAETIPSNLASKKREYEVIYQIASDNGYDVNFVNEIKKKILNKRKNPIVKDDKKFACFTYVNAHTNVVTQVLRNKYNINIAYRTNNNIRNIIGKHNLNTVNVYEKSGVYKLNCQHPNCGHFYYGQTGRTFNCRHKEHKSSVKHGRATAFGSHMFDSDHQFSTIDKDMEIIKLENKGPALNTREALEIFLAKNNILCLNEQSPYDNVMFNCLLDDA